jgi:hypothetical protein
VERPALEPEAPPALVEAPPEDPELDEPPLEEAPPPELDPEDRLEDEGALAPLSEEPDDVEPLGTGSGTLCTLGTGTGVLGTWTVGTGTGTLGTGTGVGAGKLGTWTVGTGRLGAVTVGTGSGTWSVPAFATPVLVTRSPSARAPIRLSISRYRWLLYHPHCTGKPTAANL